MKIRFNHLSKRVMTKIMTMSPMTINVNKYLLNANVTHGCSGWMLRIRSRMIRQCPDGAEYRGDKIRNRQHTGRYRMKKETAYNTRQEIHSRQKIKARLH